MCFINIDSSRNNNNYIDCLYFVTLEKLSFIFTHIILSLYVVNNIVYLFGVKYISLKRIIIELLMEIIYCLILNSKLIQNPHKLKQWLWYINIILSIIIILEPLYAVVGLYCYNNDEVERKKRYSISKKMFQILGAIIIMMMIYELILSSFNALLVCVSNHYYVYYLVFVVI